MTNRHEILLVAKDKALYFFPSITDIDVISGYELLHPEFYLANRLRLKNYQLIIFLDNGFQPAMAARIRPYTKAKIVLFFWNHFREPKHFAMLSAAKNEVALDEIAHFDAIEAKTLRLTHNSSFYSKNMVIHDTPISYDIFFGATNNGRKEKAMELKKKFQELGLRAYYHILMARGNEQPGYLPYNEYVEIVAQTRGILELLREGQQGVTLRTFESLFFQKKLITANEALLHYRFYDPKNIFLIQEHTLDELPEFLNQPVQETPSDVLEFFDVASWARRFVESRPGLFEEYEYYPSLLEKVTVTDEEWLVN
ncbi:MAG: oligosaccharide biosynthesis protein Alg14 [Enterococcus sp.]